jgi:phage tail sheath protein FI
LLKQSEAAYVVPPLDETSPAATGVRLPLSLPIGAGEARAFSFGAVYHPWLFVREPEQPTGGALLPPDGTVLGLIASRARLRGAWIAPANEPLTGVVALSPSIARNRRAELMTAQVNLITQEPRGFLTLSADTLSGDSDLVSIGVRRLLSLLRRLALREGTTYVFEPHDAPFQRLVQRGFEGFLSRMFERGAFAGRTAATSFQVVTSSSLNTPQSMDQGRFIVELRVAPALPLTFLTVRLVQSGDRTQVVEER